MSYPYLDDCDCAECRMKKIARRSARQTMKDIGTQEKLDYDEFVEILFGDSLKKSQMEETKPDEEEGLTEQGRDVLGYIRVMDALGEKIPFMTRLLVSNKMKTTEPDNTILARYELDKARKQAKGKPYEALTNAFLDLLADTLKTSNL